MRRRRLDREPRGGSSASIGFVRGLPARHREGDVFQRPIDSGACACMAGLPWLLEGADESRHGERGCFVALRQAQRSATRCIAAAEYRHQTNTRNADIAPPRFQAIKTAAMA